MTVYYPFHPLRRQSLEVLVWSRQAHLSVTVRAPDGSALKIALWMLEPAAARSRPVLARNLTTGGDPVAAFDGYEIGCHGVLVNLDVMVEGGTGKEWHVR